MLLTHALPAGSLVICKRVSSARPSRAPASANVSLLRASSSQRFSRKSVQSQQPSQVRQLRKTVVARAEEGSQSGADPLAKGSYDEPETAQEANDLGLRFTNAGRWTEALAYFEKAINLPGTGTKRFRDKPRPASDRERMTSLFNIACCHSKLGDARSGLVALAGCLEAGYADFNQIRTDPDLETLRKDERFEGLVKRYQPQSQGLLGGFNLNSLFGNDK